MSRALVSFACALLCIPTPLVAQNNPDAQTGSPPDRIDLLADASNAVRNPPSANCSPDQDGLELEGPIIVCREGYDPAAAGYDKEAAQRRYAAKTMNKGDPRAPDLFGIPSTGITVARGCFIPPCPPPKAYMIDFASLPEAPAGSDADRIARGLPPQGQEAPLALSEPTGLPSPNPSESASPAETPSG